MSRPRVAGFRASTDQSHTATTPAAPIMPAPTPSEELIEIGHLARAHGLKGELALTYFADSTDWLNGNIWLRSGERGPIRPARIRAFRNHHGHVLVQLEGVPDRTAAEQLRGMSVLIPAANLPESDDDTIYLRDLIGLAVVLETTGEPVGTLDDVDISGAQELWSISSPDGHEILFPAVPEFVSDVDLDAGIVRIMPPPGLLELYAEGAGNADAPPAESADTVECTDS